MTTILENTFAFLLFSTESYHIMGHFMILLRIRLLPRKDLARLKLYFVADLLSVFFSSFLFLQNMRWLAGLHLIQHLYYVLFWEKSKPAKKIVSWSSLDWVQSDYQSEWHLDSILGTLFDIVVHIAMVFNLIQYLTTVQILVSMVLVQSSLFVVIWSPKFAWSHPSSIPAWVKKRLQPVTEDKAKLF